MGQESAVGREPFFYVEIDLDICSLTYGTLPCTASGAAGDECYNTFATCQDRPNFATATQTFKFSPYNIAPPLGETMFPCIVGKPGITPARLEIEKGIGQRGAVAIKVRDFPHDDAGVDNYKSTRPAAPAGTFFNKLRRRNPFYQNRPLRLITGYYQDGAIVDTTTRLYLIDSFDGPDRSGSFSINAKDILKLADDKSALCPKEYDIALNANITAGATSIALRSGDGAKLPATTGTIRFDDEIIAFTGVSTDTLTGCSRAQWGTTAAAHDAGKKGDLCKTFSGVNVVNVIEDLLLNFAGIDAAHIPFDDGAPGDEWDDEKTNWLSSNTLTHIISRPTKVSELLKELSIQNSLSLWYNEVEQKIKMSATSISLGNQLPQSIDDVANVINDSFRMVEDKDSRLSQIWIFYDPKDYSENKDAINNYQEIDIFINDDFEDAAAWGEPRIERIYANWLSAPNAGIVSTMASRLLKKDLTQTFAIEFALDAKDASLWTGEFALLNHPELQGVDGLEEVQKIQITQVKESEPGHRYEYKARAKVFDEQQRFFFIASNSVGDYSTATATEKAENGFISDGASPFSDVGQAYSIT